jgi:hypothetical protein
MSDKPAHPGTITFVDANAGTENVRAAGDVPETIAYCRVGEHWVPVTRVVALVVGNKRDIKKYAADGTLLETTAQFRKPPR